MKYFLPTMKEYVERIVDLSFDYDPSEIETNTLFDPEERFYDIENRMDSFGLVSDIPPFSGTFRT